MTNTTKEDIMTHFTSTEIRVILESLDEVVPYHNKCVKLYDKDIALGRASPDMSEYIQDKIAARKRLKKLFDDTFHIDMRECDAD